jgi:hypothetical protein
MFDMRLVPTRIERMPDACLRSDERLWAQPNANVQDHPITDFSAEHPQKIP